MRLGSEIKLSEEEHRQLAVCTADARQGMRHKDMRQILKVAKVERCIIMVRAVNPGTALLLDEGHPTKGFHIKGKSSDWGPMRNFIPVDQSLSKLSGSSLDRIEQANAQVRDCLAQGSYASVQPLVLSKRRFQQLLDEGAMRCLPTPGSKQINRLLIAKDPTGAVQRFVARPAGDGWRVFYQDGKTPVQVLADTMHHRPYVADYDLHEVMPLIGDYGHKDRLPYSPITFDKHRSLHRPSSRKHLKKSDMYAAEDPDKGNISRRVDDVVTHLNVAIARGPGLNVFHHNSDAASPHGDMSNSFPITMFTPGEAKGLPAVCMIRNRAELKVVMQKAVDMGFCMRHNTNYGNDFAGMRRASFVAARERLTALWSPIRVSDRHTKPSIDAERPEPEAKITPAH